MTLLKWQSNVSPFRGMPVDDTGSSSSVTSQSGETIQMYYNNSGTLTADAGQAAGTVVMMKTTYNNILNNLGDSLAKYGDTSLSFTSTALTSEVGIGTVDPQFVETLDESSWSTRMAAIGAKLTTNGQYFVDYSKGVIYAKKASTQSTLTSGAYKYQASAGAGSVSVTSIVPGTGATNLGKAEDAVHASGDVGVMALGVGNVAQVTFAADGDYIPHATDTKGNAMVVGNVASVTTDAGNPVKIGMIYNTSAPAPTNGQRVDAQADSAGNLKNAEQFAAQAEDNTAGVFAVAHKPLATSTYSWTRFQNLGANSTLNVKSSAGNVFSVYCHNIGGTAGYLQLHRTATTPGGGAVPYLTYLVPAGGTLFLDSTDLGANGHNMTTGIAFAVSSTEATYTADTAANYTTQIMYN